jgi:hypothetical protein
VILAQRPAIAREFLAKSAVLTGVNRTPILLQAYICSTHLFAPGVF